MIAYTLNKDNSLNILGGSPSLDTLHKILPNQEFEVCQDEDVTQLVNGSYMLTADVDYQKEAEAKAEQEKQQAITALDNQYNADKAELMNYYMTAMLDNDTDTMEEIKAELAELAEQYDADLEELLSGPAVDNIDIQESEGE